MRGLRARGGFEVDLTWRHGALVTAVIRSTVGGTTAVRHGDRTAKVRMSAGQEITLSDAWKAQPQMVK